jgi:hypothetical protein
VAFEGTSFVWMSVAAVVLAAVGTAAFVRRDVPAL